MASRILITGVGGFIGRRVARDLAERGHAIVGLARDDRAPVEVLHDYHPGSVLDAGLVERALAGCDAVVHLAALTAHADIVDHRHVALRVNYEGTKNVLDGMAASDTVSRFLYSSTGKVYGQIEELPITERHPLRPLNLLGKSKRITEGLVDFYSDSGRSFDVLRIFNVYGPGQRSSFLVPTIVSQVRASSGPRRTIVLGDIEARRDYVHVADVSDAMVRCLERERTGGLDTLNICSGDATSAADIVNVVGELEGVEVDVDVDRDRLRPDEVPVEYGSPERARETLGWEPTTGLREGLADVLRASRDESA